MFESVLLLNKRVTIKHSFWQLKWKGYKEFNKIWILNEKFEKYLTFKLKYLN